MDVGGITGYSPACSDGQAYGRVYAASDLHVDYAENRAFVSRWSSNRYLRDSLIVAGDVSDDIDALERTLAALVRKFRHVFFVPGNHELWLRPGKETFSDSVQKFYAILEMCDRIGVITEPRKVHISNAKSVWIVPLHSWYSTPEDDPDNTLFCMPKSGIDDGVHQAEIWMDTAMCKWPQRLDGRTKAGFFSHLNRAYVTKKYDAPVISFSHFLPQEALIHANANDLRIVDKERLRLGLNKFSGKFQGSCGEFNFTRFAGSDHLGRQVSKLKSSVHVYGHQHRNRDRLINGTRYISHCLGSPRDRREGWTWGWYESNLAPKLVELPCSSTEQHRNGSLVEGGNAAAGVEGNVQEKQVDDTSYGEPVNGNRGRGSLNSTIDVNNVDQSSISNSGVLEAGLSDLNLCKSKTIPETRFTRQSNGSSGESPNDGNQRNGADDVKQSNLGTLGNDDDENIQNECTGVVW